ncbi:hypothetical protein QC761_0073350 [Podospora bellae-mahoneyi]|uniref:Uncharacterized protein n=1 Tax=Podospora bellae-mahoneyi TaxID=2093777 RepID=A0ABR0FBL7_9PEZI|nr:hypothetical protein QC761_0073350 [Podospora bellae-mahoneyi]
MADAYTDYKASKSRETRYPTIGFLWSPSTLQARSLTFPTPSSQLSSFSFGQQPRTSSRTAFRT